MEHGNDECSLEQVAAAQRDDEIRSINEALDKDREYDAWIARIDAERDSRVLAVDVKRRRMDEYDAMAVAMRKLGVA